MSVDNAKKVLDVAGHGLSALEAIGEIASQYTSGRPLPAIGDELRTARNVIQTIREIVNAVRGGLDGSVSVEDLEKEIAKLASDLKQNDTAIDAAIDAKPER